MQLLQPSRPHAPPVASHVALGAAGSALVRVSMALAAAWVAAAEAEAGGHVCHAWGTLLAAPLVDAAQAAHRAGQAL